MTIAQTDLSWYYSGGADNTLGSASFELARAANQGDDNKTFDLESTVTTSTGVDRRILKDSARIGDGDGTHVGKAMLIVDGSSALSVFRVVEFRSSDGRYIVEAPFPATVAASDTYQLHEVNSLFGAISALDCATGIEDYRLVYFRNEQANTMHNVLFYHRVLGVGPDFADIGIELWARIQSGTSEQAQADDREVPSGILSNDGFVSPRVRFDASPTPARAFNNTTQPLHSLNSHRAIWVKRIVPPNCRRNDFVVVQIIAEGTDSTDATVVLSSMLCVFSLVGFTPAIELGPDRGPVLTQQQISDGYTASMHLGSGARMKATVRAIETGLPVPDYELGWTQSGPGELFTPDGPVTDANGVARSTYSAPADAAEAGRQTIAFEVSASSTGALNDVTTTSHDHTVVAGTERALYAFVYAGHEDDPPADLQPFNSFARSVKFGGVNLERLGTIVSTHGGRLEVWQLLSPAVGLGSMVVTFPLSIRAVGFNSMSFSGVDQANPLDVAIDTKVTNNDPGTVFNQSLTTVTAGAELVAAVFSFHPLDFAILADPPAVIRSGAQVGNATLVSIAVVSSQVAATPGAHTIGHTNLTVSQDRLGIAFALRPALVSAIVSAQV